MHHECYELKGIGIGLTWSPSTEPIYALVDAESHFPPSAVEGSFGYCREDQKFYVRTATGWEKT